MAGPKYRGAPTIGDRIDLLALPDDARLAILCRRTADRADELRAPYLSELLRRAASKIDRQRGLDAWLVQTPEDEA